MKKRGRKIVSAVLALAMYISIVPILPVHAVSSDTTSKTTKADTKIETGDIPIDEKHFPDAEFREYVKTFSNDGSTLTKVERESVKTIIPSNVKIESVKGLEYFPNLEGIYLGEYKSLLSLDVSQNPQLKALYFSETGVSQIDLSNNSNLEELGCSDTPLTSLKLDANTKLKRLDVFSCIRLSSLDISKNTALEELLIDETTFTSIDLSKNVNLKLLQATFSELKTLDISKCTKLEYLMINNSSLTSIDLSKNIELMTFYCRNVKITALDLSKNLKLRDLEIFNAPLNYLDLSHNESLRSVICEGMNFAYLNISNNHTNLSGNKFDINSQHHLVLYTIGNSFNLFDTYPGIVLAKIINTQNVDIDLVTGVATVKDMEKPVVYEYACGNDADGNPVAFNVTLDVKKLYMGKYGKQQAFDMQRNVIFPKADTAMNLWDFREPLDQNGKKFALDNDDYISFENTGKNVSDLDSSIQQAIIKQYAPYVTDKEAIKQARVVKEVVFDKTDKPKEELATYGIIWALHDNGFLFTAMSTNDKAGGIATYFTNQGYQYGSSDSYVPSTITPATKAQLDKYIGTDTIKVPSSDKATQDYQGIVQDEKGTPISNATISIQDSAGHEIQKAISDSNGNFMLDDIVNGKYNLVVETKEKTIYSPVTIEIKNKSKELGFSEQTKEIYDESQSNQDLLVELDTSKKKVETTLIQEGFFLAKFYQQQLFDVYRNPIFPNKTENLYLCNMNTSYDENMVLVDWDKGHEDYIKFFDTGKTVADLPKEQIKQVLNNLSYTTSTKETLLKARVIKQVQFHEDGATKKVITNYGLVWSLEEEGFFYFTIGDKQPGTLVTTKPFASGGSVILQPKSSDPVTKIEELSKYDKALENPDKLAPGSIATQGIGGIVSDKAGNKIEGVEILIKDTKGNSIAKAITDSEGRWRVNRIAESEVTVLANKDGNTYPSITIQVKQDGSMNVVNIVLKKDEEKPVPDPTPNPIPAPPIPDPNPVVPSPLPDLDPTPNAPVVIPEEPIVEVTPENIAKTTDNQTSSPIKTGDTTKVVLPVMMILVTGLILMFSYRRRKE